MATSNNHPMKRIINRKLRKLTEELSELKILFNTEGYSIDEYNVIFQDVKSTVKDIEELHTKMTTASGQI